MSSTKKYEKGPYNILTLEQCEEFKKNHINPLTKKPITDPKRIEYIVKKCDELKKKHVSPVAAKKKTVSPVAAKKKNSISGCC
jgi:chorismate mutase